MVNSFIFVLFYPTFMLIMLIINDLTISGGFSSQILLILFFCKNLWKIIIKNIIFIYDKYYFKIDIQYKSLGELSMRNWIKIRSIFKDERAISEEFTILPALSIVMIGFALFVVLLAQTYLAYTDNINRLQNYQTTDGILQKLTNPDCYFIRNGGLIDIHILQNDTRSLQILCTQYQRVGITFVLRLQWGDQIQDFPADLLTDSRNRIAVSKEMGIYLNEAQTIPGIFTILLWRDS
jgi:hypothetical protein